MMGTQYRHATVYKRNIFNYLPMFQFHSLAHLPILVFSRRNIKTGALKYLLQKFREVMSYNLSASENHSIILFEGYRIIRPN